MADNYRRPPRYRDYEDVLGFVVNRASFALRDSLSKRFREAGFDLTAEDFAVMNRIGEQPGRSQREISELTFKDGPAVSRTVARLSELGLVETREARGDRRINRLHLSRAGDQCWLQLLELADRNLTHAEQGISAGNLEIATSVLRAIWRNLQGQGVE